MPYYSRHDEDDIEFDEYDPTPFGGGYDLALTYGRPLQPSSEICYPSTSFDQEEEDYFRPHFAHDDEPSAYGEDALNNEYSSYGRPKPRPGYGRPHSSGYDRRPEPEYGSGYGVRPSYEDETPRRRPEESYGRPSYEDEPRRRPSYGGGEGYNRYERRGDDDEGYGRKKYGGGDDSDDEDGKRKHHHRKHYGDDDE